MITVKIPLVPGRLTKCGLPGWLALVSILPIALLAVTAALDLRG